MKKKPTAIIALDTIAHVFRLFFTDIISYRTIQHTNNYANKYFDLQNQKRTNADA